MHANKKKSVLYVPPVFIKKEKRTTHQEDYNVTRNNFKNESNMVLDFINTSQQDRINFQTQTHHRINVLLSKLNKKPKDAKLSALIKDQYAKKNSDQAKYRVFVTTLQKNIKSGRELKRKKRTYGKEFSKSSLVSEVSKTK